MNTKAFFTATLFFATLMTAMSSCQKIDIDTPADEYTYHSQAVSSETKVEADSAYAFVRIGMYENIGNHSVTITNLRIEAGNSSVAIPQFGSNLSDVDFISSDKDNITFDTCTGDYSSVLLSGKYTSMILRFDALVSCDEGYYTIEANDIEVTIGASKTKWESNGRYTYSICVDAEMLGLTEITYDVTVSDYETVNVTKTM
ncbi:MAG: hypothetical protein ACI4AE_00910 [Candidatus Cryptobacteroides sp.]